MRPDRDAERCPSCRGRTAIPSSYGSPYGVSYRECPSCYGQGFVGRGDVSPREVAAVRQGAARDIRQDRSRFRR